MPLFYQHNINENEKLGVWKIEEDENFFLSSVTLQRNISHAHKRLQHLAGRYLLKQLFTDFPYGLIEVADTRKPFLANEDYHFSISHCGEWAAALVSRKRRVGIDIELVTPLMQKLQHKFLSDDEMDMLKRENLLQYSLDEPVIIEHMAGNPSLVNGQKKASEPEERSGHLPSFLELVTLCWSAKEAMYKWYGTGSVDFKNHMKLQSPPRFPASGWIVSDFIFSKDEPLHLQLCSTFFEQLVLTFVIS